MPPARASTTTAKASADARFEPLSFTFAAAAMGVAVPVPCEMMVNDSTGVTVAAGWEPFAGLETAGVAAPGVAEAWGAIGETAAGVEVTGEVPSAAGDGGVVTAAVAVGVNATTVPPLGPWPQTCSKLIATGAGALLGPPLPHFQACMSPSRAFACV